MKFVFALLALFGMSSANATVYDFDGVITAAGFDDPDNVTGIALGSKFSGFFDYEPEALTPVPPNSGLFLNGVRGYEFTLGTHTYSNLNLPDAISSFIKGNSILFADPSPTADGSSVFADDVVLLFSGISGFPPSLDHFDRAQLSLVLLVTDPPGAFPCCGSVSGDVTSFVKRASVPEPSTYALFGIGLFGIAFGYRGRRRHAERVGPMPSLA